MACPAIHSAHGKYPVNLIAPTRMYEIGATYL